jgi:hypothetical protein
MANPRRFILIWLASLLGLTALTVGINLLIDPYEVFGTPRIAGLSALKPAAKNHSMLAKTYQVARAHPATVLIGHSVVYLGIDAFDPAWPQGMRPVYNYGVPGGSATTYLKTLREAIATGSITHSVVFLDFQNFLLSEPVQSASAENDRRFHVTPDGRLNADRRGQVADDMFLSLATMGALIDSISTVVAQRTPNSINLAQDGSSTAAEFSNAARVGGMHVMFAQKNASEADGAARMAAYMAGWRGPLPNLETVSSIIKLARAHDVKLTLVIAPHHADAMEIYWRAGLWPRIEQLKLELASLVAGGGKDVVLWDFMDYSAFSTEAVPPEGDRQTSMRWFWEPVHFKKELGGVMIARMFDNDPEGFGVVLTPDNVQERNEAVRAQRHALVCGGDGPFRTVSAPKIDDGCLRALGVESLHGPS